jgi:hypothetical protein
MLARSPVESRKWLGMAMNKLYPDARTAIIDIVHDGMTLHSSTLG